MVIDTLVSWFSRLDQWLADENHRWLVVLGFVLLSYVYLFVAANQAPADYRPEEAPTEEGETALFLLPSRGGYCQKRGDPSSAPLFEWNTSEIVLLVSGVVLTLGLTWYFFRRQGASDLTLTSRIIEYILLWTHIVLLLMFLPVNAFHTRLLYNFRSWAAQLCNDPLKELAMAFFFIVMLPLPGSTSHSERLVWLALKIGIFYIGQSFLLGSPHYTVEPESEHAALPETRNQLLGYGVLLALSLGFLSYSTWKTSRPAASPPVSL